MSIRDFSSGTRILADHMDGCVPAESIIPAKSVERRTSEIRILVGHVDGFVPRVWASSYWVTYSHRKGADCWVLCAHEQCCRCGDPNAGREHLVFLHAFSLPRSVLLAHKILASLSLSLPPFLALSLSLSGFLRQCVLFLCKAKSRCVPAV